MSQYMFDEIPIQKFQELVLETLKEENCAKFKFHLQGCISILEEDLKSNLGRFLTDFEEIRNILKSAEKINTPIAFKVELVETELFLDSLQKKFGLLLQERFAANELQIVKGVLKVIELKESFVPAKDRAILLKEIKTKISGKRMDKIISEMIAVGLLLEIDGGILVSSQAGKYYYQNYITISGISATYYENAVV